jgi:hypothetical protein
MIAEMNWNQDWYKLRGQEVSAWMKNFNSIKNSNKGEIIAH